MKTLNYQDDFSFVMNTTNKTLPADIAMAYQEGFEAGLEAVASAFMGHRVYDERVQLLMERMPKRVVVQLEKNKLLDWTIA